MQRPSSVRIWPGSSLHCATTRWQRPFFSSVPRGQMQRPSSVRIWPGSSLHCCSTAQRHRPSRAGSAAPSRCGAGRLAAAVPGVRICRAGSSSCDLAGSSVHCCSILTQRPFFSSVPRGQMQRPSSVRIWPGRAALLLHRALAVLQLRATRADAATVFGADLSGNSVHCCSTLTHPPLRKVVPSGQTQRPASFSTKPSEHCSFTCFCTVRSCGRRTARPGRSAKPALGQVAGAVDTAVSGGRRHAVAAVDRAGQVVEPPSSGMTMVTWWTCALAGARSGW